MYRESLWQSASALDLLLFSQTKPGKSSARDWLEKPCEALPQYDGAP